MRRWVWGAEAALLHKVPLQEAGTCHQERSQNPFYIGWRDPSEDSSSEPWLTSCPCLPPLAFCRMGTILATIIWWWWPTVAWLAVPVPWPVMSQTVLSAIALTGALLMASPAPDLTFNHWATRNNLNQTENAVWGTASKCHHFWMSDARKWAAWHMHS